MPENVSHGPSVGSKRHTVKGRPLQLQLEGLQRRVEHLIERPLGGRSGLVRPAPAFATTRNS